MTTYQVQLDWFEDDQDFKEVEAETLDEAARKVWDEWSPTGWTGATLAEGRRYIGLDLKAATFEDALWDSATESAPVTLNGEN